MTSPDSLAHAAGCGQNYYKTLLAFLRIPTELQVEKILLSFVFFLKKKQQKKQTRTVRVDKQGLAESEVTPIIAQGARGGSWGGWV